MGGTSRALGEDLPRPAHAVASCQDIASPPEAQALAPAALEPGLMEPRPAAPSMADPPSPGAARSRHPHSSLGPTGPRTHSPRCHPAPAAWHAGSGWHRHHDCLPCCSVWEGSPWGGGGQGAGGHGGWPGAEDRGAQVVAWQARVWPGWAWGTGQRLCRACEEPVRACHTGGAGAWSCLQVGDRGISRARALRPGLVRCSWVPGPWRAQLLGRGQRVGRDAGDGSALAPQ